jgi:LPXTG-motif cell wall-anchored protein
MASGSNTTLGGYDSSWECVNTNGTSVIAQGSGSSGSVTIPLATGKGASVTCTITNIPKKDGSISWSKVDKDNQSAALSGSVWELTGPTAGSASTTSVADCVADSAAACADQADKDPAAGKFLVNGLVWGNYTLKEKTAPAGYELSDQIHQVTVNKSTTIDLGPIANTVIPRAVLTIKKIILSATGQQSPGVGWFMDTSLSTRSPDGTAVTGDTTRVTTASGSVATAWPITFNDVSESAIVTVAETQQQGYEFSSGSCVVTTSGGQTSTITLSGTSGDVTGITPGSSTSCEFVNREKSGKATWNKTADDGSTLAGSVWTLEYPDGHTVDVTGDGQGLFSVGNLPWGQYKLSEKESPAGYQRDTTVHDFIIDATHLDVNVVDSGSTSIANNKQNVPELPMTGGASTDAFIIVGVGLLALACALGGGYVVTAHRRGQKIFHSKH